MSRSLLAPLIGLILIGLTVIGPFANAEETPTRTDADIARDANDHPRAVLAFFGVTPGMTVLDLFAGGGYYSQLLGHVVGESGRVIMHNNAAYLGFAGKTLDERIASGNLSANVARHDAEIGALGIEPATVDMVLMVMTYHDLYFKTDGWNMNPDAFFAEIRTLLKPGGVLAIIDHAAADGSRTRDAQDLHRVEEAFARADIEAHGFRFTGMLDVLRNPADDHTLSVFDPAIRGKTDRFVHRYVLATDR